MSLTKRYIDSLPQEEQDDILGVPGEWLEAEYETVPQTFCKPDEEPEVVETNDLNDVPTVAAVERQSISLATRLIGNYAFFPGLGWRRYVTLASATWNQYLY
jgi:hypothetical protein